MARIVVIADPETALGFQLAGAEVECADDFESARDRLLELLSDASIGLIAAGAGLLDQLDDATRRRVEASSRPVVMPLPRGRAAPGLPSRHAYLAAMLRRAIGFHVTFPGEEGA
jgi:V/A-type H+-transporting ATPase subunit F